MTQIIEFLQSLHSADGLRSLVQTGGWIVVVGFVFAETGLLAGFFLPGDSLLVTAGIFTSSEIVGGEPLFSLWPLIFAVTLAAIVGDQLGYFLGKKVGPMIYKEKDSMFFKKKHLLEAETFYQAHGPRALIGARFVPIFRTFVPFAAGMARMPYAQFLKYNIAGGILWVWSMILVGHFLGKTEMAKHLHYVILVVIGLSVLPIAIGVAKRFLKRPTAAQTANA